MNTKSMVWRTVTLIVAAVLLTLVYACLYKTPGTGNADVSVTKPYPEGAEVSSPLTVAGSARSALFINDQLPVTVVNWDGLIIGEALIPRISDNAGESMSSFEGSISFTPTECGVDQDFCRRGWIIFGTSYEQLVHFK